VLPHFSLSLLDLCISTAPVSQECFLQILQALHSYKEPTQRTPSFNFERCREAALHNAIILESFNFGINKSIRAQQGSQVFYCSEFKDPSMLQELLEHHLHWGSLQKILQHSANFPLLPLDLENCWKDLLFHREHENHKSADEHHDKLDMIISDEIQWGLALPPPVKILHLIPNASLAPLGCHQQETIHEHGEKIPKYWMTHNQSFPGPSGQSINSRVIKEFLPPCMHSVLLWSIHYVSLRLCHPTKMIFLEIWFGCCL
jgi:hypothetical protein